MRFFGSSPDWYTEALQHNIEVARVPDWMKPGEMPASWSLPSGSSLGALCCAHPRGRDAGLQCARFKGYNPFDLYAAAKPGRGEALPPHLVFAELGETAEEACAFLNAYGPLDSSGIIGTRLAKTELKAWEKASAKSSTPEEVFRKILGEVPHLPSLGKPQDDFRRYRLDQFWQDQSEFELALRLSGALNSAPSERYRNIRRALTIVGTDWQFRHGSISGFGLEELPLLGRQSQGVELQYIFAALHFVTRTINSHLSITTPRIVAKLGSVAVEGILGLLLASGRYVLDALFGHREP